MSQCLVKNSEYQIKLAQSGIPEPVFYSFANTFMAKHGRFPNLDEFPGVDSSKHLKDSLHINKYDSAKIETILNVTQTESIEQANILLNDTYSDLEVQLLPLNQEAIVTIDNRPSQYSIKNVEENTFNDQYNASVIFNQVFDKLRKLYGIQLIPITEKELATWDNLPEVRSVSAFVHEGNIYINTDLADIDAPIHEMTHILLGSIRYKNPELYMQLIQLAESFPNNSEILRNNPNRAYSDLMEEAFVEEVAKYLSGKSSQINKLDSKILFELHYNIKRLLDSVLMGQYSVKSVEDTKLFNMSIMDLAKYVNSKELCTSTMCSMDDAKLHRILSNVKSDLFKSGDLREECL